MFDWVHICTWWIGTAQSWDIRCSGLSLSPKIRDNQYMNFVPYYIPRTSTDTATLIEPEKWKLLCFVVRYSMSILVLQSSWWGRESWLLCLICLPGVSWWLRGSSSRCHRVVCSLWLWYFLIILTYYFGSNVFRWANKTHTCMCINASCQGPCYSYIHLLASAINPTRVGPIIEYVHFPTV